jgi:hypothetical protein
MNRDIGARKNYVTANYFPNREGSGRRKEVKCLKYGVFLIIVQTIPH